MGTRKRWQAKWRYLTSQENSFLHPGPSFPLLVWMGVTLEPMCLVGMAQATQGLSLAGIEQGIRPRTWSPSPLRTFQRTQTSCSLSLVFPSSASRIAASRSLVNVSNKTDLKGLIASGCGAYKEYSIYATRIRCGSFSREIRGYTLACQREDSADNVTKSSLTSDR